MIAYVTWSRILRLITRTRRVPMDAETRARLGTRGWLMGRDITPVHDGQLDPDPPDRP